MNRKNGNTEVLFLSMVLGVNMNGFYYYQSLKYKVGKGDYADACD